jgi:hypothetical protein
MSEFVTVTVDTGHGADQRLDLGLDLVRAEIAADARPEAPRLADVDDLPVGIEHAIDARTVGQPLDVGARIELAHRLHRVASLSPRSSGGRE